MKGLTQKQRNVFDFIVRSLREQGVIPSIREICNQFGYSSTNAANVHLYALEKKGYITRRHGLARNIEISSEYMVKTTGVPIVGQVAAGLPIDAVENLDGYLDLDSMYARGQHFALRIVGDSMIDAGLWDGDYAIVRRQERVESGEIGVAVIEGEATVKRFSWQADGHLELIPANEKYRPFSVNPAKDFLVAGKVVGMHRVMN